MNLYSNRSITHAYEASARHHLVSWDRWRANFLKRLFVCERGARSLLRFGVRPAGGTFLAHSVHAKRAPVTADEPIVHAMAVEVVTARQPAEPVSLLEVCEAHCAAAERAIRRRIALAQPNDGER